MIVTVFGATGQVGRQVVVQALAAGHAVRAYARRASDLPAGAQTIIAELDDEAALEQAIDGADAVISALGPRRNHPDEVEIFAAALARITRIMQAQGVRRLVSISGAALPLPGDPPDVGRAVIGGLIRLITPHVLAAKARERDVILAADLDWVLVRPGRILPGERTGKARPSLDKPARPMVASADVAAFMLEAASDDRWVRTAPFIG